MDALARIKIEKWTTDEVCTFLDSLGLGQTIPAFKQNAVTGDDLVEFSEKEFTEDLGLTHLQAKKVMKHISQLKGGAPPAAAAAAAPAADKATPAPAYQAPQGYPAVGSAQGGSAAPFNPYATENPYAGAPQQSSGPPQQSYGAPSNGGYQAPPPGYPVAAAAAVGAAAGAAMGGGMGPDPHQQERENKQKAAGMLGSAAQELQQACQLLGAAKKLAGGMMAADVIADRPFGFMNRRPVMGTMMNMGTIAKEQEKVQQAEGLCKRACAEIQQAQRICPQIPGIDTSLMGQLSGGAMMGAIFMPGLAQAMRAQKIGQMERSVEQMLNNVQIARRWLQNI